MPFTSKPLMATATPLEWAAPQLIKLCTASGNLAKACDDEMYDQSVYLARARVWCVSCAYVQGFVCDVCQAMRQFLALLDELCPGWDEGTRAGSGVKHTPE